MKVQLAVKPLSEINSDYIVLPVFEEDKKDFGIAEVKLLLKDDPKFGKLFESQLLTTTHGKILMLGVGKLEKFDFITLQNWVGAAVKPLMRKAKQVSIVLPLSDKMTADQVGEAAAVGAEIATHDIAAQYKSEHEPVKLTSIELVVERAERGFQDGIKKGAIIVDSINLVRRLGDMPANEMTPTFFLNEVKKVVKDNKLKLTVLTEAQAKKKGMGAFCGVAQGSDEPSYMIAVEYTGDIRSKDKWALVGKGITFDTGGINIKPGSYQNFEMKYDMCGAATALAVIQALSKQKSKRNVVAVMAVTENLISGKAQRPGDVVKTYSGKTAEVLNTDAEGRLVLIDALSYAQKDFKANKLIDIATLTGAIIIALGDHISGTFSNNEEFSNQLQEAGKRVGERFWPFPMDDDFNEMIKGDFGDIINIGVGGSMPGAAGSITGAKFIEAGVENDNPWIHLDIAGTAWDMKARPYRGLGATGVGVKTLVELISS
jgi:leucyl aminopeptidase